MVKRLERNDIISRGERKFPSSIKTHFYIRNGLLIGVSTVPGEGVGGAGATTLAKTLHSTLGLPEQSYVHAGKIIREKARKWLKRHHPELYMRLKPGQQLPDRFLKIYTDQLKERGPALDRNTDRSVVKHAQSYLKKNVRSRERATVILDGKLTAFLTEAFWGLSLEERPLMLFLGVHTDDKTADERAFLREKEQRKKRGEKLFTRSQVKNIRRDRRRAEEQRYRDAYKDRVSSYTHDSVKNVVHLIIDSTKASPIEQVCATLNYLAENHPYIALTLIRQIATNETKKTNNGRNGKKREENPLLSYVRQHPQVFANLLRYT